MVGYGLGLAQRAIVFEKADYAHVTGDVVTPRPATPTAVARRLAMPGCRRHSIVATRPTYMTQPPPHCSDPTGLAPEQSDWVARFDSRLTTGQSYFSQSGAGGSAAYCDDDYHVELWQVYLMDREASPVAYHHVYALAVVEVAHGEPKSMEYITPEPG